MTKLKQIFYLLLSLVLIICMLSGCTQDKQSHDSLSSDQPDEKVIQDTTQHYEDIKAKSDYDLAPNCTLSVYDKNNELYNDYSLHIIGTPVFVDSTLSTENQTYESTKTITTPEPYNLHLDQGVYTFTLTDNANPKNTHTFTASVLNDNQMDHLDVYTEFGNSSIKQIALSADEQYRINIFLSNFSEQWFHEVDRSDIENPKIYLEKFESQSADIMEIVDFAWLYSKINLDAHEPLIYEDFHYYGISIDTINSISQRFFGRSVAPEDIRPIQKYDYFDYILVGDKVCRPSADGETYNHMTVADTMQPKADGSYVVPFKIYIVGEKYAEFTSIINNKEVYYFTPEAAAADSSLTYYVSGTAEVKPFNYNGNSTFQLISYELLWENEPADTTDKDSSASTGSSDNTSTYITEQDLFGEWTIDTEYTMDYNDTSMTSIFGTSYKYGCGMEYGSDNYFDYYIAAGIGGKGSYRLENDSIHVDIIEYENGNPESFTINVKTEGGVTRLVMEVWDYQIFWIKV